MLNEGNQIHNLMSSSGSGTVINYGSGSDFLRSYGSGSTSWKVTVPVPQRCFRQGTCVSTDLWAGWSGRGSSRTRRASTARRSEPGSPGSQTTGTIQMCPGTWAVFLKTIVLSRPVLRIRIRVPVLFWTLGPGSGIGFFRIPDLGTQIPNPYFWLLNVKFWVKVLPIILSLSKFYYICGCKKW